MDTPLSVAQLAEKPLEGYEGDTAKAAIIIEMVKRGVSPTEIPVAPRWRETFIALCIHTDLPVARIARMSGISLSFLRLHFKRGDDPELKEYLNLSRAANYERRIDEPTHSDLRSPAIPLAGLNALANWEAEAKAQKNAAEEEVDKAIEMRKQLITDLKTHDDQEEFENERRRLENKVASLGVMGLDEDVEIDEEN